MQPERKQAVVLVGHGGLPTDYPRERLTKLKALEGRRRATGTEKSSEEVALEQELRSWPRTPATDPYQTGLETLAGKLKARLNGALFSVAYNEFCAPTVEDAIERLIGEGATAITVIPSMLTPGGSHSEVEIPEILAALRLKHPGIEIRYAWPFDLDQVAGMLAQHLTRHEDD